MRGARRFALLCTFALLHNQALWDNTSFTVNTEQFSHYKISTLYKILLLLISLGNNPN